LKEGLGEPETVIGGLLCGITTYMIRILCESPNAMSKEARGQMGYTPQQIGDMTIDQIYMLLTDWRVLRSKGKNRTEKVHSANLASMADEDGFVRGRAADGTPLKLKSVGKSMARIVAEREAKKKKRRGRR